MSLYPQKEALPDVLVGTVYTPGPARAPLDEVGRTRRRRSPGRRGRCVAALFLVAFALASLSPRPARADDTGAALGVALVIALGIADITFITYDAVVARNGELPSNKWAIAELVVTSPQSGVLTGVTAAFTVTNEPEVSLATFPFAVMTGTLTTHSVWSLAFKNVGPDTLFYASPAIAADVTLTAAAFTAMFGKRRVFTREMGIAEVLVTVPQVIGGAYKLGLDDTYVPGWAAFTAWSSALLLHGVASIALDRGGSYDGSASSPPSPARRALRPKIDHMGPGPVASTINGAPAYGLVMRGTF